MAWRDWRPRGSLPLRPRQTWWVRAVWVVCLAHTSLQPTLRGTGPGPRPFLADRNDFAVALLVETHLNQSDADSERDRLLRLGWRGAFAYA
eukprot:15134040-Alexandrium_andersonii.AAC.1